MASGGIADRLRVATSMLPDGDGPPTDRLYDPASAILRRPREPPVMTVAVEPPTEEHRDFIAALTWDENGYPLYRGLPAGLGGSCLLRRP